MFAGIETYNLGILSRWKPGRPILLAKLLKWARWLAAPSMRAPSIRHLNDRALKDLNLRRWEVEFPDPRAPRLF